MKKSGAKSESTRKLIIQGAIEVFAQAGFTQASFQAIADHCGLSHAAAFYYFPDKEALIPAALEKIVMDNHEFVHSLFRSQDDAHTRLMKHFEGNLSWALQNPSYAQVLLLTFYFASFKRDFTDKYIQLMETGRMRIIEYLDAGQREGIFRFKQTSESLGVILHNELTASMSSAVCRGPSFTLKKKRTEELEVCRERWTTLFSLLLKTPSR